MYFMSDKRMNVGTGPNQHLRSRWERLEENFKNILTLTKEMSRLSAQSQRVILFPFSSDWPLNSRKFGSDLAVPVLAACPSSTSTSRSVREA